MLDTEAGAALAVGLLGTLREVPEVHGSFLVSELGHLLARDVSPYLVDDVLIEVAGRMLRLTGGFTSGSVAVSSLLVRFGDCLLYVRPASTGLLCILAAPAVNVPALRMGANVISRRLVNLAEGRAGAPASGPMSGASAPGAVEPAAVRWRGSVLPKPPS